MMLPVESMTGAVNIVTAAIAHPWTDWQAAMDAAIEPLAYCWRVCRWGICWWTCVV
jgi:hypothetical protein